jgi:antitoxin component of RelBE/YafQ-DinJ toxin-antitoxin module
MAKKPSTFTIDEDVKQDFKIQTIKDGIEMSDAVEQMMVNYVAASKKLHAEREKK